MAESCSNCHTPATRLIGKLAECDACWKYRKRHDGQPRPSKLIGRQSDNRFNREAARRELEVILGQTRPDGLGRSVWENPDLAAIDKYGDYPT